MRVPPLQRTLLPDPTCYIPVTNCRNGDLVAELRWHVVVAAAGPVKQSRNICCWKSREGVVYSDFICAANSQCVCVCTNMCECKYKQEQGVIRGGMQRLHADRLIH